MTKFASALTVAAGTCLATVLSVAGFAGTQPVAPKNLCIEGGGSCAQQGTSSQAFKWHPGHYMLLPIARPMQEHFKEVDQIANEPAVKGFSVQIWWAEIETGPGEYNWSKVDAYLAKAQAVNKRLIVRINDRKFSTTSDANLVPDYVRNMGGPDAGLARTKNGFIAKIWKPEIMDRMIALYQAFGARYNSNPYLEGIATEESTPGFNATSAAPSDYDSMALHAQWQRLLAAARRAFPNTQVFFLSNFLSPQTALEQTMRACAVAKCSFSGPDIFPGQRLDGYDIARGVLGAHDYRGEVPIAPHMEAAGLGGRRGNFLPQQIYDYAKSELHANYIIWRRNTWFGTPAQQWEQGILPVIRANPTIYTNDCPSSISCNSN